MMQSVEPRRANPQFVLTAFILAVLLRGVSEAKAGSSSRNTNLIPHALVQPPRSTVRSSRVLRQHLWSTQGSAALRAHPPPAPPANPTPLLPNSRASAGLQPAPPLPQPSRPPPVGAAGHRDPNAGARRPGIAPIISRLYYDKDGNHISQSVTWGGEVEDRAYSKGKTLLSSQVESLLGSAISSQKLPHDPGAVYFLLSDQFVTQCPSSCIPSDIRNNTSLAPTGDPGMDGLVSVFAHEFAEATSSPFISTWFDGDGYENADKCAWK
ncbi:unnamed protein product [Closterium sp. NIES-65]|nr:unnamed protein product [Closterium sp. NIES-65]